MSQLPPKPDGSRIEEIEDFDGRSYRWKPPGHLLARLPAAAFLICWLGGWTFGGVMAITHVLDEFANGTVNWFLLFWLGGWAIGWIFVASAIYFALRPVRPESVTLGRNVFRYDSGSSAFNVFARLQGQWSPGELFRRRRRRIEIFKTDLGPIKLDRIGERQRLYFDHGADRVEIGEVLTEPEREWLAAVIDAWKAS